MVLCQSAAINVGVGPGTSQMVCTFKQQISLCRYAAMVKEPCSRFVLFLLLNHIVV